VILRLSLYSTESVEHAVIRDFAFFFINVEVLCVRCFVYESEDDHLQYVRDLTELLQLHMNTVGVVREALVESIFRTRHASITQGLNAIYLNTFLAE
jgi:hypothetical protein